MGGLFITQSLKQNVKLGRWYSPHRQYLLLEFKVQLIKLLLRVIYPTPVSTGVPDVCCEHQVYYSALWISLIQELCIKH